MHKHDLAEVNTDVQEEAGREHLVPPCTYLYIALGCLLKESVIQQSAE